MNSAGTDKSGIIAESVTPKSETISKAATIGDGSMASDCTPCSDYGLRSTSYAYFNQIMINGWRKQFLYSLIFATFVVVIGNIGLTFWLIRVMNLNMVSTAVAIYSLYGIYGINIFCSMACQAWRYKVTV
jgi:hypothetical protein